MSSLLAEDDVFALNPASSVRTVEVVGQRILIIDDFFAAPEALREAALTLNFIRHGRSYPGRRASVPREDTTFRALIDKIKQMANADYLPHLAAGTADEIASITSVKGDFGITDQHPAELTPGQKQPHRDPIPLIGLVYLNKEERGGTLFFEQMGPAEDADGLQGYFTGSNDNWRLRAKAEGRFNRFVLFPGELAHSAEIEGDWILDGRRLLSPRLTMRLLFHTEQSLKKLSEGR
jgi:hypothetical protein